MKILLIVSALMLMAFGCGEQDHQYPLSDHYDGKKFKNLENNEMNSFISILEWKWGSEPKAWPTSLPNKDYTLPKLGPTERAQVTFINHATFLFQLKDLNVLSDPIFSERASPFKFMGPKRVRAPGVYIEMLPPIDVVLISHNHYDHLDIESLKLLDSKFHPLFLVPLGDSKLLLSEGIQNVKEMDWWEEVKVKETRFTFTPSQHWSSRGLFDKQKSLWGSYMIINENIKVYFGGDTGYSSHFKEINRRIGRPHLSLLPIGAYEPRWFMKVHHMNPEEAVRAHLDLDSELSIGMHFGTFQLTDEGIDEPVDHLKDALFKAKVPEETFITLEQGDSKSL